MTAFSPRPSVTAKAFIENAPDAAKSAADPEASKSRAKSTAISLTLPAELLAAVDRAAKEKSLSRASYIKLLLAEATRFGE